MGVQYASGSGVERAGDVARPGAHDVRSSSEGTVDVARTPVVADEIDLGPGLPQDLEFADEPFGVVVHGGIEAVGQGRAGDDAHGLAFTDRSLEGRAGGGGADDGDERTGHGLTLSPPS